MKYSQAFAKTLKGSKNYDSANATFLIRGGFIDQTMAGVYTFLPLGLRVLSKIENIVREEMNKISQELYMPAISPRSLWETTGRADSIDVLLKVTSANDVSKNKNEADYILNSTQEEVVTPIAQKFNPSYKDFPFSVYQIQSKFRNEPRPKSGILRGRQFQMKDAYSFHTSEEDLLRYYHEEAKTTYVNIFQRLGLGDSTVIALASGGDFTDEFSHEFQTICETGEDTLFYSKSDDVYYNREVTPSKAPDLKYESIEQKEMEAIFGEGIIGVEELEKFLGVPAEHTTKTLIYEADGEVIVASVRGVYDIDEGKLKKAAGVKSLKLASEEAVRKVTGAEVGYAGLVGLPENVRVFVDESVENMINFETGGNKTHYHNINVNWDRDVKKPEKFYDIKVAKEGDLDPKTGEAYEYFTASEVGNIFPLNTKFTKAFGYEFTDEEGNKKPVYMGCYGIGTTRAMGVIVEKYHDEKGIIWPMQVAPYQVHLISLGGEDETVQKAESLYSELNNKGIEVLWDDRDESAGTKFSDADLIGIPIRIVISKRSLENGGYEVKLRREGESQIISGDEILDWVKKKIEEEIV